MNHTTPKQCPTCEGSGWDYEQTGEFEREQTPCLDCNGTGRVPSGDYIDWDARSREDYRQAALNLPNSTHLDNSEAGKSYQHDAWCRGQDPCICADFTPKTTCSICGEPGHEGFCFDQPKSPTEAGEIEVPSSDTLGSKADERVSPVADSNSTPPADELEAILKQYDADWRAWKIANQYDPDPRIKAIAAIQSLITKARQEQLRSLIDEAHSLYKLSFQTTQILRATATHKH